MHRKLPVALATTAVSTDDTPQDSKLFILKPLPGQHSQDLPVKVDVSTSTVNKAYVHPSSVLPALLSKTPKSCLNVRLICFNLISDMH